MKNRKLIPALLIALVSTTTFAGGLGLGLGGGASVGAGVNLGVGNVLQADVNHQTQIDTSAGVRAERRESGETNVGNVTTVGRTRSTANLDSDASTGNNAQIQTQVEGRNDRPIRRAVKDSAANMRSVTNTGIGQVRRSAAAVRGSVDASAEQQVRAQGGQNRQIDLNAKQRAEMYGG